MRLNLTAVTVLTILLFNSTLKASQDVDMNVQFGGTGVFSDAVTNVPRKGWDGTIKGVRKIRVTNLGSSGQDGVSYFVDPTDFLSIDLSTIITLSGEIDKTNQGFTYAWTLTSRPAGSTAVLSDPTASSPTPINGVIAGSVDFTQDPGASVSFPFQKVEMRSSGGSPDFTLDAGAVFSISPVPEPASLGLFAIAGFAISLSSRRRNSFPCTSETPFTNPVKVAEGQIGS